MLATPDMHVHLSLRQARVKQQHIRVAQHFPIPLACLKSANTTSGIDEQPVFYGNGRRVTSVGSRDSRKHLESHGPHALAAQPKPVRPFQPDARPRLASPSLTRPGSGPCLCPSPKPVA